MLDSTLLVIKRARAIPFSIHYHSLQNSNFGALPQGWYHNYEKKLVIQLDGTVDYYETPNRFYSFEETPVTGEYRSQFDDARYHAIQKQADGSYILRMPSQEGYHFQSSGLLESMSDPDGRRITLSYDASNRLDTVPANYYGTVFDFEYDASNRLTAVNQVGAGGRTIAFTHGEPFVITDAAGYDTSYYYEGTNFLKRATDHEGRQIFKNWHDARDGSSSRMTEWMGTRLAPSPTPRIPMLPGQPPTRIDGEKYC